MLIIRKEQMDVFQRESEQDFQEEVMDQLRSSHADAIGNIDEDLLCKRVAYGIARAREYGLTWKSNLMVFVELMFDLGPQFDQYPAFLRCLTDVRWEPNYRMGKLIEKMNEDDWTLARQVPAQWPHDCRLL